MKHALRICNEPGCPAIAVQGGRCALHRAVHVRVGWWTPAEQQYDAKRGTPAERGYDSEWRKIRAAYLKHNPYCVECGDPATDVDHIVPLRKGGTHDDANLQSMCHAHHSSKTWTHDRKMRGEARDDVDTRRK